jgi:hypothetical protein
MRSMGFSSVRVLKGGFHAWRERFDVEPVPAAS